MNSRYVQYGCGWCAPETWRNFDASLTLRFERLPVIGRLYTKNDARFPENVEYGDITRGLPVPDDSCRGVYCSHILEHLSLEDFRSALINTHRILEKGCCFRLVVPDLECSINRYINDLSPEAALIFMAETLLGREKRNRGVKGLAYDWFGNSMHLWMWDYKSLVRELGNAGFVSIRRAEYGDAADVMFNEVEQNKRWQHCLGVECKKAV